MHLRVSASPKQSSVAVVSRLHLLTSHSTPVLRVQSNTSCNLWSDNSLHSDSPTVRKGRLSLPGVEASSAYVRVRHLKFACQYEQLQVVRYLLDLPEMECYDLDGAQLYVSARVKEQSQVAYDITTLLAQKGVRCDSERRFWNQWAFYPHLVDFKQEWRNPTYVATRFIDYCKDVNEEELVNHLIRFCKAAAARRLSEPFLSLQLIAEHAARSARWRLLKECVPLVTVPFPERGSVEGSWNASGRIYLPNEEGRNEVCLYLNPGIYQFKHFPDQAVNPNGVVTLQEVNVLRTPLMDAAGWHQPCDLTLILEACMRIEWERAEFENVSALGAVYSHFRPHLSRQALDRLLVTASSSTFMVEKMYVIAELTKRNPSANAFDKSIAAVKWYNHSETLLRMLDESRVASLRKAPAPAVPDKRELLNKVMKSRNSMANQDDNWRKTQNDQYEKKQQLSNKKPAAFSRKK